MKYPVTPDGRYFVVRGRLWRCSNPDLTTDLQTQLTRELMKARSDKGRAMQAADSDARENARQRVDAAKQALGERGSVWWTDGATSTGTWSAIRRMRSGSQVWKRVSKHGCIQARLMFALCSPTLKGMGYMKRRAMREEEESRAKGYLPGGGMHPPRFHPDHRLLNWPGCNLELRCGCGTSSNSATWRLAEKHGNRTFREVLAKVKCSRCGAPPVAAYLLAGFHRTHCSGAPPDWAIELIPPE